MTFLYSPLCLVTSALVASFPSTVAVASIAASSISAPTACRTFCMFSFIFTKSSCSALVNSSAGLTVRSKSRFPSASRERFAAIRSTSALVKSLTARMEVRSCTTSTYPILVPFWSRRNDVVCLQLAPHQSK